MTIFKFFAMLMLSFPAAIAVMVALDNTIQRDDGRFGAFDAIEEKLGDGTETRGGPYLVSMDPDGDSGVWTVRGYEAGLDSTGGAGKRQFVATLRMTCQHYADEACWAVQGLEYAATGDASTGGPSLAVGRAGGKTEPARDDKAYRVLLIQTQLKALGFDPGPLDGVMGQRTKRALAAYGAKTDANGRGVVSDEALADLEMMGRLERVRERYQDAQLHAAMQDLQRVIRADPDNSLAHLYRGQIYRAFGMSDLAIDAYDTSLALSPQQAVAYYSRGNAHYRAGRYGTAFADYADGLGTHVLGEKYLVLKEGFGEMRGRAATELEPAWRWAKAGWQDTKDMMTALLPDSADNVSDNGIPDAKRAQQGPAVFDEAKDLLAEQVRGRDGDEGDEAFRGVSSLQQGPAI